MPKRELSPVQLIERSITKKYRKTIWSPFVEAIKRYELIKEGDKIAVCISGGKDSALLAVLFKLLKRHTEIPFELEYLCMNPGYSPANMDRILENAKKLDLPLTVFNTDIFEITEKVDQTPCYLCARMRRGHLYAKAKELGCNKIALGHHFSDVIETTMLGLLYGSQVQAMLPKLHSKNFENIDLIRPLYCVHEDDVKSWVRYNDLSFLNCACKVSEQNHKEGEKSGSKRQEIKLLIKELKKENPNVEKSIFNAIHNVKLDTLVEYTAEGVDHSFLEKF